MKQLSSKLHKVIRNQDLFAHKPEINFDRFEKSRKSFVGGFVSFFITLYMLAFIFQNLNKFHSTMSDNFKNYQTLLDFDKIEDVKYEDLNATIFFAVRKKIDKKAPIYMKDGLDRYINITFMQAEEDWDNQEEVIKERLIKTKQCDQYDFGTDDTSKKLFESWNGFSLFCPQVTEQNGLKLHNI